MAKGLYSGNPLFNVNELKIKNRDAALGGKLVLQEGADNGVNTITIKSPASVASDVVLTLPTTTGT